MEYRKEKLLKLHELVTTFKVNIKQYKSSSYDEANTRVDYIDKFFELLDWDVRNTQGFSEQYREVVREDKVIIQGKPKAPDYSFRIGGVRKFFVEAKKPSVNIKEDTEPAFQIRRYSYTAKLPLAILTDFEEFAVYDTRIKPNKNDKASTGRIFYCTYDEYEKNFAFIYNTFSKIAILKGSFDRYIEENKNKKGTSEVDKEFLKLIDYWREHLAKNIALRNKLSIDELNYAVQKIIDRIIFLRIAEDRKIEDYGCLKRIERSDNILNDLLKLFHSAEKKYNSSLFNFKKDTITPTLKIDNKVLKDIIKSIYYPDSPYEFSVFDVEILGNIYEQFLGKSIRLTNSGQAKVEYKPEVKKAGGVFYTPKYIVDYISKNTIGEIIRNKSPKQIESIKILDPACGSGSFLLGAYDYLLDYHLNWYIENNPKKYIGKSLIQTGENEYNLTIEEKRKILLNNIFGVDIDYSAVEVTKLSLVLKLLEGETVESTESLFKYSQMKVLPDLSTNIKCGNSLINSEIYSNLSLFEENNKHINAMDWDKAFPEIFKKGGFDVVIGNPPYVKEYTNKEPFKLLRESSLKKYYEGKMDLWYAFACLSIDLLKENGYHSFIATNNWITAGGASILRNKIIEETTILQFIDFSDFKVFGNAAIQTMVYILKKAKPQKKYKMNYTKILNKNIAEDNIIKILNNSIDVKENKNDYENFKSIINLNEFYNKPFTFIREEINNILEKIKEKSNYKLDNKYVATGIDVHQDFVIETHLKKIKDKSIKKGDGIFILSSSEVDSLKLNSEERKIIKPYYTTEELSRYYGSPNNRLWIIYSNLEVRKNIKKYPNIKKHLDKFKNIITSDFKPYGLHRAREQHFFEGEKIISLRKTRIPIFTYTDFPCYVSQTYFIIQPYDINLKYLTALLNSKIIYFWLYYKGKKQGDQLQIDKAPLLDLPLLKIDDKEKKEKIISLVNKIIDTKERLLNAKLEYEKEEEKLRINALEDEIDRIFYRLYEVNDKDIIFIKSFGL